MDGYLLDTNIFDYLTDRADVFHAPVQRVFAQVPDATPVFISAITAGEVEYGIQANPGMSEARRLDLLSAVAQFPVLGVTSGAGTHFGKVRAVLFERNIRNGKRSLRPEQLVDPVTSLRLGVQENDLWIVAQALEHNLTLVTHDRRMRPVWEAAGPALRVEDWADPDFSWPSADRER